MSFMIEKKQQQQQHSNDVWKDNNLRTGKKFTN